MVHYEKVLSGTATSKPMEKISFLLTLLCNETLREYLTLVTYNMATMNACLLNIMEVLNDFPPDNVVMKQKRVSRHTMQKPQDLKV